MVSTKVLLHFGQDKFHTQLSSSSLSRGLYKCSTLICSQNQRVNTVKVHKWESHLHQVILQVFSVLLFHIQLIQWYLFSTKEEVPLKELEHKSRKFMEKLDSQDFGKVLEQEFSWLVLLLAYNGLFTIVSRLHAVLPLPVESD